MSKTIKVIVVDDSVIMRQLLTEVLNSDPDITVVAVAQHPLEARELIKQHNPDVLTLDIEMPKMNGLEFLEKIMKLRPMPVVMISSLTQKGADATMQALEIGAVDFVAKPTSDLEKGISAQASQIIQKVKTAANANIGNLIRTPRSVTKPVFNGQASSKELVVIGASTGGVEALREVLQDLPSYMPPILVVQHMPAQFTDTFAKRLNTRCGLAVKEAENGEKLQSGFVYIANGKFHLSVRKKGADFYSDFDDGEPVCGHKPSVNVLFHSTAKLDCKKMVGVILSGMGRDGAEGMLALRQAGAITIGQNEKTCVVYGMPRVANEIGAVEKEYDLPKIGQVLTKICS